MSDGARNEDEQRFLKEEWIIFILLDGGASLFGGPMRVYYRLCKVQTLYYRWTSTESPPVVVSIRLRRAQPGHKCQWSKTSEWMKFIEKHQTKLDKFRRLGLWSTTSRLDCWTRRHLIANMVAKFVYVMDCKWKILPSGLARCLLWSCSSKMNSS